MDRGREMAHQSTMKPFASGDVFVGATVLNNPEDDHAGDGRIIQYDTDLNEKGVLWVEGTTHLVGGLKFHPSGELWAFEGRQIIRVSPKGQQLPSRANSERSLSHVNFACDGSMFFGEHLVGNKVPDTLGTPLARLPGSDKLGDGNIYKFNPDGELLATYDSDTHGGMAGFLGVTHSVLTPEEDRVIYTSETGNRIMQFDVVNDRQLPDLATY